MKIEIAHETAGNPTQTENAVLVRELAMDRVDVTVVVDADQVTESGVTQKKIEGEADTERNKDCGKPAPSLIARQTQRSEVAR